MAKNAEYWDKRRQGRLVKAEVTGQAAIERVQQLYEQSLKNIEKEVKSIYDNYSKNGTLDVKELQKAIGPDGAKEFMKKVQDKARRLGIDPSKIYDERYLGRLTRLQALQEQVKLEVLSTAPQEELLQKQAYSKILKDNYAGSQRDLAGQGIRPAFSTLDNKITDTILSSVWAKGNYSNRVWGNNNKLAMQLPTILGGALPIGQSYEKTARQIRERYDVTRYESQRLIRTETNYFYGQSEAQSYIDDGIQFYTLDVTLDGHTSTICLAIDEAQVHEVANIIVGVNYNPFHPFCRTSPRPVLNGEYKPKTKLAERTERFIDYDKGTLKQELKAAMQKQMNPNKAAHDYNADLNLISQAGLKGEELQNKLTNLINSIPDDYPLKNAIKHSAALQFNWKEIELSEAGKTLKKNFDNLGWDFKASKLDENQIDFFNKSGVKLDRAAEESILSQGQYNSSTNTLSIASDRVKTTARVLEEPTLYEKVVKHELGHAIDYYAPFLDKKGGDFFSQGPDFVAAIKGKGDSNFLSEFSNEAVAVFKHRFTQGMGDKNEKLSVSQMTTEDFRSQLDKMQAVKIGKIYKEVPFDTMTYMLEPKEVFAESYALYSTDPKYLKSESPSLFNYINQISKLKL